MTIPFVIDETQLQPFNFYHQGKPYPAVLFRNTLYVQQGVFNAQERLQAYDLCCQLSERTSALITVNRAQYRLWTDPYTSLYAQHSEHRVAV